MSIHRDNGFNHGLNGCEPRPPAHEFDAMQYRCGYRDGYALRPDTAKLTTDIVFAVHQTTKESAHDFRT